MTLEHGAERIAVGGASLTGGSGLRGLADRVAALDGRLELDSPPAPGRGCGVEIPLSEGQPGSGQA